MAYGTAPHRLSPGVWATRDGRKLTPAGSAYWEHHFRTGRVTTDGHIRTPSVVQPGAADLVAEHRARVAALAKQVGHDFPAKPVLQGTPMQVAQKVRMAPGGQGGGPLSVLRAAKHGLDVAGAGIASSIGIPTGGVWSHHGGHTAALSPGAPVDRATLQTGSKIFDLATSNTVGPNLTKAVLTGKGFGKPSTMVEAAMLPFAFGGGGEALGRKALTEGVEAAAKGAAEKTAGRAVAGIRAGEHVPATWPERGLAWQNRFEKLPEDAKVWLFHGTDQATAEKFAQEGINPAEKPMSLGRQRHQAGEYAEFQPGSGLSPGLSVGHAPWDVSGYGRGMVGVRVNKSDIEPAIEQGGASAAEALRVNDAQVNRAIPSEDVKLLNLGGRVPDEKIFGQLAPSPEEQVAEAFGGAGARTRTKQDIIYSAERQRRGGLLSSAFERAGGGMAGHRAALRTLRGELPKLPFDQLRHLDEPTMDKLLNTAHLHPNLMPYEKNRLRIALIRAREGNVPRESEIKLVEKAFGPAKAAQLAQTVPTSRKIGRAVAEVANIPRSVMATLDVSAVFRQALMAFAHNPKTVARQIGPMFHYLVSEKGFQEGMQRIASDPEYARMMKSKLGLTEMGDIEQREEQFASHLAEKMSGGKYSPIRASGRAYTGLLNEVRYAMWKNLTKLAEEQGVPASQKLDDDISKMVNWATGRGHLGEHEQAAMLLNSFLFSPRLLKSRIDAVNPAFYAGLHPFARKQALNSARNLVAGGSAVLGMAALAGAKIQTDPTSSDWGKIKIGNTRFDIWGGHQQLARTLAQMGRGQIKSTTQDKTIHTNKLEPGVRFIEGKFSPPMSLGLDYYRQKTQTGQPFKWSDAAKSRLIPLLGQDAYDTFKDRVRAGDSPEEAFAKSVALYGIGAFGIGTQTYPRKKDTGTGPFSKKSPANEDLWNPNTSNTDIWGGNG